MDKEGNKAGDDIIIYDRLRFPTIRILEKNNFAQKEKILFEAVYCYIEAKHNLELDLDKENTLDKALNQIKIIKSLRRPERSLTLLVTQTLLNKKFRMRPITFILIFIIY